MDSILTILGVKLPALIASFFGSAVSLSYAGTLTKMQMLISVISGMSVAIFTNKLFSHIVGWPEDVSIGICFLLALGSMRGIPVFFAYIDKAENLSAENMLSKSKENEK
jgi:hypothetical protein